MSTVIAFPPSGWSGRSQVRSKRARSLPPPEDGADIVILPVVRIERHGEPPVVTPERDCGRRGGAFRH